MASIIDELKRQDNAFLKNEAAGIELFRNLKHDKESLDLFLKHTVAEILTTSKKRLFCTSNEMLVKKFSPIKMEGATMAKVMRSPFETSPKHNTLTWDLVKNKYASISGNGWQILNFLVIDEANVELLHKTIIDLLKKVR